MIGITVEICLHALGAVDFPIYDVDEKIGYMPKADQQGQFLNKNDWVLNNRALGTLHQWPTDSVNKNNVMLVGDSVVWGGNPLKQEDKLGDQLEKGLGPNFAVWPASAGGWSVANEIEMIRRNQDIYSQSEFVVWFINSGDFSPLAESASHLIHPNKPIICATCFYIEKYMLPKLGIRIGMENPPIDIDAGINEKVWQDFYLQTVKIKGKKSKIIFVLYPNKDELLKIDNKTFITLKSHMYTMCHTFICIDLSKKKEWHSELYRDGIHPSVKGNLILSKIIAESILK